jgi:hypothetical protein
MGMKHVSADSYGVLATALNRVAICILLHFAVDEPMPKASKHDRKYQQKNILSFCSVQSSFLSAKSRPMS